MAKRKRSETKDVMAAASRSRRAAHFANGGTVAMWRGRSVRIDNAKKQASKTACRKFRHDD